MERKEMLSSPEFWQEYISSNLFEMVSDYLKENNLKKKDLADKMGVNKSHISQLFKGEVDHRLSKIIKLAIASNKVPYIFFKDLDQVILEDDFGQSIYLDFKEIEPNQAICTVEPLKNSISKVPTRIIRKKAILKKLIPRDRRLHELDKPNNSKTFEFETDCKTQFKIKA